MKYFSVLIFYIQKTIVNTMLIFIRFIPQTQSKSWVIGVQEIAGLISNTHKAIPELISVNLFDHKFNYGGGYTYENMLPNDYKNYFKIKNYLRVIKFIFVTPIIFVHLLLTHSGFIYIGPRGFLISEVDNRAFEFKLLKKFNRKINRKGRGARTAVFVNDRRRRLPLPPAQLWRGWGAVIIIFDHFRIKMDEINRK